MRIREADLALPIPGFPGYFVTREGSIWSRRMRQTWRGLTPTKPRQISTRAHPRRGYMRADLFTEIGSRIKRTVRVAQAVAWAWIGSQPEGRLVCHRDGVNTHDHVSNLYYGTHAENMLDLAHHNRYPGTVRPRADADDPTTYTTDDLPSGIVEAGYDPALGF